MSKEIYKQIIEENPIPYATFERETINNKNRYKIIFVNKGFETVFKVDKNKILNGYVDEFISGNDSKVIFMDLKPISEDKFSRIKYLDSQKAYFKIDIYSKDNIIFNVRYDKLTKENDRMPNILKTSPFIAWAKDLNGRYIDVNDLFLSSLQLNYEDVIGKKVGDILDAKLASLFRLRENETLKKNELTIYEEKIRFSNEKEYTYESAVWPYKEEDEVLGVVGISIDITEKEKLKKTMEEQEKNFLDMANNIDEVIIICDEKKALYVSPYFEVMFGHSADELYLDLANWKKFWDSFEYVDGSYSFYNEEIISATIKLTKNNSIEKWIHCKCIPIFNEEGKITKRIGLLKDITKNKKDANELENIRLEFFANLSHELRTPINLIMSALQIINLKLDDDIEPNFKKYLNIIHKNGFKLLRLVNNLIDITKLDAGSLEYKIKNHNIITFVENICMLSTKYTDKKGIRLIFDTDVEEKIIGFDSNHMERIILNILSNSIKFNKDGGSIEVSISTKENIEIKIKDTGRGISKGKLDKLFVRYNHVNQNDRQEMEGSGIGLSLVKALLEIQDGTINITSTENVGTEIIITLPNRVVESKPDNINEVEYNGMTQLNKMEVEFSDIDI